MARSLGPVCAAVGLAVAAVHAAAPISNAILACRDIAEPTARLACFDREAAALVQAAAKPSAADAAARASPTAAAPPAAATPPATQPPAPAAMPKPAGTASGAAAAPLNAEQQFGLPERAVAAREVAAGTRASDLAQIDAHIARIAAAGDTRMIFTLDNGQVWRQLQAEGDLLTKQGDAVTISRGVFGSFWLRTPSGRGCKVTRLR